MLRGRVDDVSGTRRGVQPVSASAGRLWAGPGECVALLFERCAPAVVAMVAVLKTGAAYLPIDPANPPPRVAFMLGDAVPVAAVTTAGLRSRLAGHDLPIIDVVDALAAYPGTPHPCRPQ